MRNKMMIVFLILLFFLTGLAFSETKEKAKETGASNDREVITKTYFLKYANPKEVRSSLSTYIMESSYNLSAGLLSVVLHRKNVSEFETLLKRLDVEKQTIQFRVFTVVASMFGKSVMIPNKELNDVIAQLQKVLSFKAFRLDGVSLLTLKDGTSNSMIRLTSRIKGLNLRLLNVTLRSMDKGNRVIDIRELRLDHSKKLLMSTTTSLKENGYLVAGVSRLYDNGDALVLVINAQIK